jgi:ATP-binding cassette subfamily B protein/subfamily B ATP-binding cassette protein MsbA
MSDFPVRSNSDRAHSSRQRYRGFVDDYRQRRLDEKLEQDRGNAPNVGPTATHPVEKPNKRRFLRQYFTWLKPHRYAVAGLFLFAAMVAGLEMIEPLFMRFIIDRVLLNTSLDSPPARQRRPE